MNNRPPIIMDSGDHELPPKDHPSYATPGQPPKKPAQEKRPAKEKTDKEE